MVITITQACCAQNRSALDQARHWKSDTPRDLQHMINGVADKPALRTRREIQVHDVLRRAAYFSTPTGQLSACTSMGNESWGAVLTRTASATLRRPTEDH
jgi:hypothetical protein